MSDKIQDKRKRLYDALVAADYDAGADFNDFNNLMDTDEVARQWVYDTAKSEGWKVGDNFEQFVGYITPAQESPTPQVNNEPYEFGKPVYSQAPNHVEGDIYKHGDSYTRTEIPYRTVEYPTLGEAQEAEKAEQREDALAAYRSAYNRLEAPGEVDEKTLIEWGNNMENAPIEQKNLYTRIMGQDATNRVDLDAVMRTYDETRKSLEGVEDPEGLAVYLMMPDERKAKLPEDERSRYEGLIKDKRKTDAVDDVNELHERISSLMEQQRVSDIKMRHDYLENRSTGQAIKDAILGIPVAETPQLQGVIPSSGLDLTPEGKLSNEQNAVLTAAGRKWNEMKYLINAAQNGNLFDGLDKALGSIDTWTSDQMLRDNMAIMRVANKFDEEGEKSLTDNERALLDALALNVAVSEMYGDEISNWYKGGEMLGEMAPFMLEMLMNPLAGLGKKAADKVTRKAIEKYGKELVKKNAKKFALTRGAAKLGASVAGATGMALTTGLPAVGADIQKRMLGDATYGYDDEGNIEYTGHVGGEGLGTSAYKAVTSRMLDNVSEMLGAEYANLPLKWLQKAGKGTKLLGWIDNLANSKFGKGVSRFAEKTKWNGPIEEFLEEVHVGLINPVLVGDQSWEEFFTKDNLATIAIGVAVPGAAISTANTIAGAADGAFKVGAQERWKMQNAEAMGYQLWQDNPNEWNDLTRSLMVGQMEDVEKTLKEVYNNPKLTPEQKKVALEYGVYSLQWKTAKGVEEAFNDGKKFIDPMLRDIYGTAYAEKVSPVQANNAYKAMVEAEKNAQRVLGLGDRSVEEWLNGRSAEEATNDAAQQEALKAYQAAKLDFEGRRDRYIAEKERAYMESDRSIQANDNNGMVYATQLKDEPVFITGGNVVLNEDGTIDVDNSSETLYVKFPDGHVEMTSPDKFTEVFTSDRTADLKAAKRAEIDAKWKAEFDTAEAQSVEQEKRDSGVVFDMTDAQGEHRIEILNEGEKMSDILLDGAQMEIPTEELNRWKQEAGIQSADAMADDTTDSVAPTGDNAAQVETAPVELPDVPDFFRLNGTNYEVASRNDDGSVDVMVNGKRETLPAGTDYSTLMPTDKKGDIAFADMPVERTHEYFVQRVTNDKKRAEMIDNNRKKAEAERKKFDKDPDVGLDPDKWEEVNRKWEEGKKAAQAKVDYWNEVAKREAEITRSETREAVENIKPDVMEETADEFIANQLAGIKITPESFKRETGLSNAEQAQLVGVISNDGVSVERAAEIILENYESELAGMGFTGDVQDVRDIIISVLSQGNPRSYAKKGREAREAENMDQQRADAEAWAKGAFDMTLEELYLYEETLLPRMMRDYEGFDENEYYSNLAENNVYDTTRESESIGRGGELLQGEQPVPAGGTPVVGQRNEGGAVSDDVQGGSQNGVAQEEVPVNEPVGNSEQLSSSEIPNNQSVAEGHAPGQSDVRNVRDWLTPENLDWAENKTLKEIIEKFGNALEPIARIPEKVMRLLGIKDGYIYSGKGYFIDHAVNHHPEVTLEEYDNIQSIISDYDDIKDLSTDKVKKVAFIKKLDKGYAVVAEISEENGKVLLHKTFFYKDSNSNRIPYKNKPSLLKESPADGSTTISPEDNNQQPADTENISALDASSASEDRNSVSNSQENTQKSGEIADNEGEKAKTPMQKLADRVLDRAEEKRRIPLRERARELEAQVGVKANIIESLDEVKNSEARKRIAAGEAVAGWYSGGQVYLYMPNIKDRREIELTYVHEVVAHHGVKKLLGERFDEFLDGVWNMMSEADRARMLAYVGANENPTLQDMRAAADEYVAELAEKMNLGELEQSTWDKIVNWLKELLENIGFENLTKEDIESMLKASYSNLRAESGKGKTGSTENDFRARMTFHGSGAQFDRFDHAFMGTGEGAQAFGWGTYVTDVEGIGRTYATTMRDKLISEKHKENAIINKLAKQTLESSNGNKEGALDYLRGLLNESWSDKKRVKAQIKIIETGKFLPETKLKANLYTVEIPDDNGSNYLHWDKPINGEIQERIANGLQSIGFEIEPGMNHLAYSRDGKIAVLNINAKGEDLYAELSDALGSDKAASLFLNDLGFVGISYPANATTGGRADGARNYVVFNENDAQIKDRTMFRVSRTPQEFDATQAEAVEKRGIVAPGLNEAVVNVVDVPRHDFTGNLKEARAKAKEWAIKNYTGKEFDLPENAGKYVISKNAIGKYLDKSAFDKSENAAVHLSVLKELPNVISNSIEAEIHADYSKGVNGERSAENGVNRNDLLVHRIYGAVNIDGKTYRVKTTIHEFRDANTANTPHSYEVTKIELIEDSTVTPNDGINNPLNRSVNSISATKLLEGVEKSYDEGKKVLDESKNSSENPQDAENGIRFRKKDSERRQEKRRINDAIDTAAGFITVGGKKQATKNRLKKEAERKQLAKEMYSSVLKGDFNDVTLSQIDKFIEDATPANPFGRRISQRLPQRMERALRQGARTNAVDALFSRISESAVPANERFSEAGRREIEERKKELLKGWAIATGNWHTDLKEFTDDNEPIGEGKDSKVYSSKDGRYVIKASKGKPYGKRFRPDIDNIALFNDVFRDTRYEILGYGEIDGEFVRILQQPIVDFAQSTPLTSEERREYMQSLGFEPLNDANTAFADGEIVIADLQKGNVVRDAAGNISVIDADAKLHTKDVGGDYTYPPVEEDLPEDSGTRFRITPEMDAEYMAAVENGDMETAERMVKEAAKMAMPDTKIVDENGYPTVVYHRTPNEFTIFDPKKIGESTDAGAFGSGFYLSPADFGPLYGKNLMPLFVNLKNPLMLNDANAFETKEPFYGEDYLWGKEQAENFNAWVKENGYDGVWYENNGRDEIVAFEPNQIKSADAVTYDDKGNVIPLSERFNEEKEDIRFRITDTDRQALEFKRQHKGSANIVAIDTDALVAELLAQGFTAEEIQNIREKYKKGGRAFYDRDRNTIYLLGKDRSEKKNKEDFWHENTHKTIGDLDIPQEVMDEFYAIPSKRFIEFFEGKAKEFYGPEEYAEELIAYFVEDVQSNGNYDNVTKALGTSAEGMERLKEIVEPIINYINHGRRVDEGTEGNNRTVVRETLYDNDVEESQERARREAEGAGETRFSTRGEGIDNVPTQPLTLMERITNSLLEVSAKNKENLELRASALRTFGRDINRVLSLMKAQREYDKSTVDTLVKLAKMYFQNAQLLGEVTPYEVARIMGVLNRSVGKRDISTEAAKLMDILLDAHANALAGILDKAEKIKAKKVNAAGVEVMGRLDKYGQKRVDEYRAAKGMTPEKLEEAIYDSDNRLAELEQRVREVLGIPDGDVDLAAREYTGDNDVVNVYMDERARLEGLTLAREYKETIQQVQEEIKDLKQELKQAEEDYRLGNIDGKSLKEFRKSVAEAIMESKVELIEGYHNLIYKFQENTKESSQRAKEFAQAQIDRAREIQHNANSDMEGIPADTQGTHPENYNNAVMNALRSPFPTFQGMMKKFGEKNVEGKGYLYERFVPQATMASDNEFRGKVAARVMIEGRLKGIFGKKMTIAKFMKELREYGATVTYREGNEMKQFDLTKGQMLYIYMVNKMADGQMKLRRMTAKRLSQGCTANGRLRLQAGCEQGSLAILH